MRILQFGLTSNHGGVESFVFNYAKSLQAEGIVFDYVDLQGKGLAKAEEIRRNGGEIYTLKDYRKYPFSAAKRIREIVSGGYDCVHINMLSAASPVAVVASLAAGAKVIVHSHNTQTVGIHRKLLHRINSVLLRRLPVVCLACSEEAGKWMYGDKPFTVIPNAIDIERFRFDPAIRQELRGKWGVKEDCLVLGFVGRLFTQKNPQYLARILHAVKKHTNRDVKLLVVGDGELKEALFDAAAELGVGEDILFAGKQEDTADWYSAMDAFVLPSLWEGLPLVAVEAQCAGLPCFFSDRITEGVRLTDLAYLCSLTQTADNWAEDILRCCGQSRDRLAYADQIGQTNYAISRSAELLQNLYKTCLEQE